MDERFNQTLQNMLRKYVHENKKNWDNFLDALSYAYNTSRHESTLHTPFEVMFGRKAILPIDLDVERPNAAKLLEDIEGADTGQSLEVLTSHRMEVLQEVKKNINLAQKKQKKQYDEKHSRAACYIVGAKVLKKDFTRKRRKGGKMDPKWLGPYMITKDIGKGFYKLALCENPDKVIMRVNGVHLKSYHTPNSSPSSHPQSTSPSISRSRSSSFSSSRSHTQFKSLSRSSSLSFSSSRGQSHSPSRSLSRPRSLSRSSSHGHSRSPPRSLSSSLSKSSLLSLVSSHCPSDESILPLPVSLPPYNEWVEWNIAKYHYGITLPPLKLPSTRSPTPLSNSSITLSPQTYSTESNLASTKPTKTSKCAKSSGPPSKRIKSSASKHTNSSGPPSKCTKSSGLPSKFAKSRVNEGSKKLAFLMRQKKVTENPTMTDIINVEKYESTKQAKPKHWVDGLTYNDRVSASWWVSKCGLGQNFGLCG